MEQAETLLDQMRAARGDRIALIEIKAERLRRLEGNRLSRYVAYPKQQLFHERGAIFRERLLRAGNQLGKTMSAGFETAMHLTGRYPDWWRGRVFEKPVAGWAASVTNEGTRDSVQRTLLGRFQNIGTGSIPRDAIVRTTRKTGIADAVDSVIVRSGGGGDVQAGESIVTFKAYEQGREKFQAETLDFVWFDEEPPADIYFEGLSRTNATGGSVYLTFTPLMGMSDVVKRFLLEKTPGTSDTVMTIYDAAHYTDEQREAIIASYPAHEREARTKGVPTLGSGRIFPLPDEAVSIAPFPIPAHWPRICGIDFGWDHPSAAVELAWDMETDILYVTKAYRQSQVTPILFAAAVKPWGEWLPWAWPHDGLQHDKGSGLALRDQYEAQGLLMLENKATHAPEPGKDEGTGGNGVEAGLLEMLDRMQTGRWKVFSNLGEWFDEFRMYHRDDGRVVKIDDDLLSASRYACMMRRFATVAPLPTRAIQYRKHGPR